MKNQTKKKAARSTSSSKKLKVPSTTKRSKKLVIALAIALMGVGSVVAWRVNRSNEIKAQAATNNWSTFPQSGNTFYSCQTRVVADGVNGYSVRTKLYFPKTTNIDTGINYMNINNPGAKGNLVMFYGGGRGGTFSVTKTIFIASKAYYVDGRVVNNC